MWLWRPWHQSLLTSVGAINPCPEQLTLAGVSEVSPFPQSLLTIYYQESVQYYMAHFFCVNSSVGYFMQGLTVDLVFIYPKEDSGSKTHGEKIPSAMSWRIWSIPQTQRVQPAESQTFWRHGTRVHDSRWMSLLSTKMHLQSSVATAKNANHKIHPLTPLPRPRQGSLSGGCQSLCKTIHHKQRHISTPLIKSSRILCAATLKMFRVWPINY